MTTDRTSLSAWRAASVQEFELERGGPVAKLRRVGLMDLLEQGGIPETLSGQAAKIALESSQRQVSAGELKKFIEVVNLVVKAAMVEPKVTDEPTDQSLGVREIPYAVRVKVFNWANSSIGNLRPFRGESDGDAKAVELLDSLLQAAQ